MSRRSKYRISESFLSRGLIWKSRKQRYIKFIFSTESNELSKHTYEDTSLPFKIWTFANLAIRTYLAMPPFPGSLTGFSESLISLLTQQNQIRKHQFVKEKEKVNTVSNWKAKKVQPIGLVKKTKSHLPHTNTNHWLINLLLERDTSTAHAVYSRIHTHTNRKNTKIKQYMH